MPILFFLGGLALLLFGAGGVVNSALGIAKKVRISPLVVGSTAVAIGTSLPEITVSLFGGIDKATHLALGNIIGSNIANIGLILGLSILFDGIRVGKHKTQTSSGIYFLLSIATFLVLLAGSFNLIFGTILIVSGLVVLWWQIRQGIDGALVEDKEMIQGMGKTHENPLVLGLYFIVSLVALVIGGKLLVDYGVVLANLLNISETVIGVTVVAVGTSLPELAVSIIGLIKHQEKLVIGNILGSNIFNVFFGGGILGLYEARSLGNNQTLIFFLMFSLLLSLILHSFKGEEIPRYYGTLLLLLYGVYLFLVLI